MPNTRNSGGISRKINNQKDRTRLRKILQKLDISSERSLIVRTAGQERNLAEIKRDYDYLNRLWDETRAKTLESKAPLLINEEANIIKRSIRDIYDRDTECVLVDGKVGYKIAKDFMKQLSPSHAKNIKHYDDTKTSLFQKYKVDSQVINIQEPKVALPSGGYLVIDQTEALVAIDINSGRAIKGRSVEETAYKTNLEAGREIARQLRLRDLAGLIVIDFIDMEERSNIMDLERKMRDFIKNDRARIQLGNVSQFGLLEMSRQRLRPSVFETIYKKCGTCDGTGFTKSVEVLALNVLRHVENRLIKIDSNVKKILVKLSNEAALYLFNNKRQQIQSLETKFEVAISFASDNDMAVDKFFIFLDNKIQTLTNENQRKPKRFNNRPDQSKFNENRTNNKPDPSKLNENRTNNKPDQSKFNENRTNNKPDQSKFNENRTNNKPDPSKLNENRTNNKPDPSKFNENRTNNKPDQSKFNENRTNNRPDPSKFNKRRPNKYNKNKVEIKNFENKNETGKVSNGDNYTPKTMPQVKSYTQPKKLPESPPKKRKTGWLSKLFGGKSDG